MEILNKLPVDWEATTYGSHWSFAYELNGKKREDYDFRVEFANGVCLWEQFAVIKLLEISPKLLGALAYTETQLCEFKPDALKNLGLDVALESIRAVIRELTTP